MDDMQDKVKSFNDAREWSHPKQVKDLLLNMNEEIGVFWNIIKWVDWEKQQEMIRKNHVEVENFIGDMLYLNLKLAYMCGVDGKKALQDVLDEYERRFPIDKTKGRHANTRAGGIDLKHAD